MTSQLQVLDAIVNKPFKDHLKKEYTKYCSFWLEIMPSHLTGKIKKPGPQLLCQWIITWWNKINQSSIGKNFKKLCISNAKNRAEEDIFWQEEEIYESGTTDVSINTVECSDSSD